jgi:hypothetical protein
MEETYVIDSRLPQLIPLHQDRQYHTPSRVSAPKSSRAGFSLRGTGLLLP